MIKKYIWIFLALFSFLSANSAYASNLILLLGTSTSGKTTIINALLEKIAGLEDYSLDRRLFIERGQQIKERYPLEYDAMIQVVSCENIAKVIDGDTQLITQSNAPADKKEKALVASGAIHQKMYIGETLTEEEKQNRRTFYPIILKKIGDETSHGQSLVLDCTKLKELNDIASHAPHAKIKKIIVFCPLKELSNRMEIRNQKAIKDGELSNLREGFPLWQYASLYHKKRHDHEPTLEILSREDAIKIFDAFLQNPNEITLAFIKKLGLSAGTKEEFLTHLGFEPYDKTIEITARFDAQDFFIVDTSKHDVEDAVTTISSFIEEGLNAGAFP